MNRGRPDLCVFVVGKPLEVVDELYIRSLSRKPTAAEVAKIKPLVEGQENPTVALQDFFWALLNSREFLFNH